MKDNYNTSLREAVLRISPHGALCAYRKDLYSALNAHAERAFRAAARLAAETPTALDARWADLCAYRVAHFYQHSIPFIRREA